MRGPSFPPAEIAEARVSCGMSKSAGSLLWSLEELRARGGIEKTEHRISMFRKVGSKTATDFQPSTEVFPPIAADAISRRLKLEKRGREDGKQNYPTEDAVSLSRVEEEIVSEVGRLRRKGIDAFDIQFNAYQTRMDSGRSAVEAIEERSGKLRNEMIAEGNSQHNQVMNALRDVREQHARLRAFRERHAIIGPPRSRKSIWLVVGIAIVAFSIEVILGAVFFSERSPAGLVGGINTAILISLINVAIGAIMGLISRHLSLKGFGNKLLGFLGWIGFFTFAIAFNFLVAHFRKALEEMPWEEAAAAVRESMIASPLDLGNFNAIIIALFGFLVAVMSFIDIRIWQDPRPGYNAIYNDLQGAIDDYAEEYETAKNTLDALYDRSSSALNTEALRLRGQVREAASARAAQSTLCANLDAFLTESEQVANALLRSYREANERARETKPPAYFDQILRFPVHHRPEPAEVTASRIDLQIDLIDAAAKQGVRDILAAREGQLETLPRTETLLQGIEAGALPTVLGESRLSVVKGARN